MRIRTQLAALSIALVSACARPATPLSTSPGVPNDVEFVVAATTDIHGRARGWNYDLDAPDPAVGLARGATIVDSLRGASEGRFLLIGGGKISQGNALAFVAARLSPPDAPHPVIAAMNAMRYEAVAF